MRQCFRPSRPLPALRLAGVVVIAGLTSACSETSRFAESPFSNPFAASTRADTATTGAVQNAPVQRVQSAQLAAPRSAPTYQPLPGHVGATGQPAVGRVAAAATRGNSAVTGSANGWTSAGGTPVTLGDGDTVEALSGRYGVPVSALRATNGLGGASQPVPGQQFIIPAFNPGAKGTVASAPVQSRSPRYEPAATTQSTTKTRPAVEDDEEETAPAVKKAPAPAKPRVAARPAASEDDDEVTPTPKKLPATGIKSVDRKTSAVTSRVEKVAPVAEKSKAVAVRMPQPALQTQTLPSKAKPAAPARPAVDDDEDDAPVQTTQPKKAPAPIKTEAKKAQAEPVKTAKSARNEEPQTTGSVSAEPAKDAPEFRWPARGRVISGFGSKGTSGTNDGINIAVPEGTPVKAAESGTVVYAGEEIKGYGKMVLVRHPNGYVSAYANNGDLNVKRGETVKRGQVLAKSGQSGNVTSPQLHFELRKGSEPVDPAKFLE